MTIRVDTDLQAIYIHEPLGHTCPAMTAAWTVAGLFRMEADVNLDTLVAARYGDTAGTRFLGLFLDSDGVTLRIRGNNGSASQSAGYTGVPGEDYRLALDYDGAGTARMLIDGAVVLSHTFTPTAGTNGERSFQIGGYGEISGYTNCTVARWRMWSAVLTEAQHRAEYRSLVPVLTSGLLHDWPMVAGATRLNDTVGAEPDLAQNETVPVGDGAAFIYRPSIIGTPQVFDLGQTTAPGAQTIAVPAYAEGVVILFALSDSADTPDAVVASMSSTFSGTFSINNSTPTSVSVGASVCVADVTSTGSGKTFTPTFSATSIVGGVVAIVAFLQDIPATWLTDFGFAHATGGGTTAGTASADGLVDGLALALDAHLSTSSADYPANESGWTPKVTGQSGPGTYGYYTGARLRQKAVTATGTESATTQSTVLASVVALLTVPPASIALSATISQASETDAAQAVARAKTVTIGQAFETDTAQPVSASKTLAVGQASETDAAQAFTHAKTLVIGQSSETDLAQPVTAVGGGGGAQTVVIGQAVETDEAFAVVAFKSLGISQATEADAAQAVLAGKTVTIGQAVETDVAQAFSASKSITVGQALETDVAQPVIALNDQILVIGQVVEVDTAQALLRGKTVTIGAANETDFAQNVIGFKSRAVLAAEELDQALPVVADGGVASDRHAQLRTHALIGAMV